MLFSPHPNENSRQFNEIEQKLQEFFGMKSKTLRNKLENILDKEFTNRKHAETAQLVDHSIKLIEAFLAAYNHHDDMTVVLETLQNHFVRHGQEIKLILLWYQKNETVPGDISLLSTLLESEEESHHLITNKYGLSTRTQVLMLLTLGDLGFLIGGKYYLPPSMSRTIEREILSWSGVMLLILTISTCINYCSDKKSDEAS